MTPSSLVIAEVFGPTVQGEGPSLGRRASFIRLGGCNLHCAWCDTPYTWDAGRFDLRAELTRRPVHAIAAEVLGHGTPVVVITGGEPLLHQHQPAWARLLALLTGRSIEVETNGTHAPETWTAAAVARFNVSPKLATAGDPEALRLVPDAIAGLLATGKAVFKFVCTDPADIAEVTQVTTRLGIPADLVWIMPEGTRPDMLAARLPVLAGPALDAGYNLTTRLHVLAWGDERGR